jgi:hypothetical protein
MYVVGVPSTTQKFEHQIRQPLGSEYVGHRNNHPLDPPSWANPLSLSCGREGEMGCEGGKGGCGGTRSRGKLFSPWAGTAGWKDGWSGERWVEAGGRRHMEYRLMPCTQNFEAEQLTVNPQEFASEIAKCAKYHTRDVQIQCFLVSPNTSVTR